MGCGVPAGIYAHICAQRTCSKVSSSRFPLDVPIYLAHVSSPQSSVPQLPQTILSLAFTAFGMRAPTSVSLQRFHLSRWCKQHLKRVWQATPHLVYHTPLFSGQSPQVLVSDAYVSVSSVSFTPALPSGLSSTHQVLPFLQVCKLMGRLVPIHA